LQRRRIVILSIAAVALSCALLIATDSLFTGFIDNVENSLGRYQGDIVLGMPSGGTIEDTDILVKSLVEADCIDAAAPVLETQGLLLAGKGKVKPVQTWGIDLTYQKQVMPISECFLFQKEKPLEQISFDIPDDPDVIGGIVGVGVLSQPDETTDEYDIDALQQMLGEPMNLTTGVLLPSDTPDDSASIPNLSRKVMRFKLADALMTGVHDFDEMFILVPIEELSAKMYPDKGLVANRVHIRLIEGTDEAQAVEIVRDIWKNFTNERSGIYRFAWIGTAKEANAPMVGEYQKQMKVLLFIFGLISMGIIILVFCIFYLIVMTRRKDIGILKSCGVPNPSVAGIFVLFGTAVGLVGSVCGIGLGYVIIRNINQIERAVSVIFGINLWQASTYKFMQIPNTMHWDSVIWVTGCGIAAAAIGSLIPAIAAARVKPVETLQYE
jgi:lipoprotein-releasing system permease protein